MGVVYLARHLALKREVALKMILGAGHADGEERARLRHEAEAVARLQHPNIVQIFEIGEHQGLPYLALEYVPGGSLARRLDGKPLPPRQSAHLVVALARAVQYAHERGIVHRDLKPHNVLLTTGQVVPKVTDFGLAKRLDDSCQTQSGAVLGTPSYMAPEQAAGKTREIGPAADVWALGAVLYELLTGRPPFRAAAPLDTLLQVLTEEPVPPGWLNPGVPRDLETICLKCLRKEPHQRYASAGELADDLGRFLEHQPIRARRAGLWERVIKWGKRRPAAAAIVAMAAVIVVSMVSALAWWRDEAIKGRQRKYWPNITSAWHHWKQKDPQRALALLEEVSPKLPFEQDSRGFEWYYLRGLCQDGDTTTNRAIRILPGHDGRTWGLHFTTDGSRLLSAGSDRKVNVWDTATGRLYRRRWRPGFWQEQVELVIVYGAL
jgi:hypothetical protein